MRPWQERKPKPPRAIDTLNPALYLLYLNYVKETQYKESQRKWAIDEIIVPNARFIHEMAREYNVTPDAIAGAILWEAAENPYPIFRLRIPPEVGGVPDGKPNGIPGKIHVKKELFGDKAPVAELVEQEGRVPPLPKNTWQERAKRLKNPRWAIRYIAAIMDQSAEIYERAAREFSEADRIADREPSRSIYNIRDDAGILTSLYQGGDFLGENNKLKAVNFEERRTRWFDAKGTWNDIPNDRDGLEPPLPLLSKNETMGPYVSSYRWWIRNLLLEPNGCPPEGFLPDNADGNPPPGIPPAQNIPNPTNIFIR